MDADFLSKTQDAKKGDEEIRGNENFQEGGIPRRGATMDGQGHF